MKSVAEETIDILKSLVADKFDGNISQASRYLKLDPSSGILRKWLTGERSPTLANISSVFEILEISLCTSGSTASTLSAISKERDALRNENAQLKQRVLELEAENRVQQRMLDKLLPAAGSAPLAAEQTHAAG